MKKARIRLLYEDKKQLDYILKHNKYAHKYFDFTPKKWNFKKAPTERKGRYIDRQYLYEHTGNYDGVMALLDGNELDGVYGNHKSINGKIIMQTEFQEGVYRTWKEKSITERVKSYLKGEGTGKWKLGKTKRKTKYYQPVYSFDHESGHGACKFYGVEDKLHFFVNEKSYEDFWTYLDEMLEPKMPTELLPLPKRKWKALSFLVNLGNDPIFMVEGYRGCELQNKYYKEGKSKAKCGESMHQYGVAIDYAFKKAPHFPPSGDKRWNRVNKLAQWLGFYSYGLSEGWDDGHIQLMADYKSEKELRENFDYAKFK